MRRAKIVATFGPATAGYGQTLGVLQAGVDVARLNMGHGDYGVHEQTSTHVRKAAAELGRTVGIMADLQGPKIRLGRFADGPHHLAVGDTFTITTEDVAGTKDICWTMHKGLPRDVAPGDNLLIDDGKVADDIRQHVLKVAKRLGYRGPHPATGSLRTGRGYIALNANPCSPCESCTAFWHFAERATTHAEKRRER
jgi:pyruvate kinase